MVKGWGWWGGRKINVIINKLMEVHREAATIFTTMEEAITETEGKQMRLVNLSLRRR